MIENDKPIRGFLFACTNKSEQECLDRLLFSTDKLYGPVVIRIRRGDVLFLNNLDNDTLLGVFVAVSDGKLNIEPDAFGGRYPYQVKVKNIGKVITYNKAKTLLAKFEVKRNTPLLGKRLVNFLSAFLITNAQVEKIFPKESLNKPSIALSAVNLGFI
ncbi:MAG: hypothetical protein PHY28_05105 [Dehalococcoidales bacterium]|nr:hypothetical protein [Dehalococcoidales bacterium]